MLDGLLRALPLMLTTLPTRSGARCASATDCMPPMLLPTLAYSRRMPRWSSRCSWPRIMSKMDRIGKRVAYALPSDGSRLDGPVEP